MSTEDLLQTATERLVAEFQPEEIYLFGSRAWGVPRSDSDVDLMVIVPHSDERPVPTNGPKNVWDGWNCPPTCWCERAAKWSVSET